MNSRTRSERLGEPLIRHLAEQTAAGNSTVLLSPRFGGKSLAMRNLAHKLNRIAEDRLVSCCLFSTRRIDQEQDAVSAIVKAAPADMGLSGSSFEELAEDIQAFSGRTGRPVILMAADVDAPDYEVTRRLIETVQPLVYGGHLTFVFSGENYLRDLVVEELADKIKFDEVMIAGYAEPEFKEHFDRWLSRINVQFADVEEARRCCFEMTSGNLSLAVTYLKYAVDRQAVKDIGLGPLLGAQIQEQMEDMCRKGPYGSLLFSRAAEVIASFDKSWPELESLIANGRAVVSRRDGRPDMLEFSGIAVRTGAELRFASPMMEMFVRTHFDKRRFGDFRARTLDWNSAVIHYSTLAPELCERPSNIHDRTDAAAVVNALGARMNMDAPMGVEVLKMYLAQAAKYLVGLPEVSFWRWTDSQSGWRPEPESSDSAEETRRLLPDYHVLPRVRRAHLAQSFDTTGCLLESVTPNASDAVTLRDTKKRIGPHRRKLANVLIGHFAAAYEQATKLSRERSEADLRLAVSEALADLYHHLSIGLPQSDNVLAPLTARLTKKNLGLSRFLILVFDHQGADPRLAYTPGLPETEAPTLLWCRSQGLYESALREGSPRGLGISPLNSTQTWLYLVPLLNLRLLHFERSDRPFSEAEMRILAEFGKKLETALDQTQRRSILEFAFTILEASRQVSAATTVKAALDSMIDSFQRLGSEWIRLYLIVDNQLTPGACHDPKHPNAKAKFDRGQIQMPPRTPLSIPWLCMNQRKPVVFAFVRSNPEGKEVQEGEEFSTELGIKVIAVRGSWYETEFERHIGDRWLDIPLLVGQQEYGKFSLHCTEKLTGEQLKMFEVFASTLATTLAAIEQQGVRERQAAEIGQDTALDLVVHNLGSRLTTLVCFFDDYRQLERRVPDLKELNHRMGVQLEQILQVPSRVKELARAESPKCERFDIVELVRNFFYTRLPPHAFSVEPETPVWVYADPARFSDLLVELLANSEEFASANKPLRIAVGIGVEPPASVRLTYSDNGPGVPGPLKERIFETFFSNRRGDKNSTGLGMSIVYRIVRAHGGSIRETGSFGTGAEFNIIVPIYSPPPGQHVSNPDC